MRETPKVHQLREYGNSAKGESNEEALAYFREEEIPLGKIVADGQRELGQVQLYSRREWDPQFTLLVALTAASICHVNVVARIGATRLVDAASSVVTTGTSFALK